MTDTDQTELNAHNPPVSAVTRRRVLRILAYTVPAVLGTVITNKQVAAKTLNVASVTLSNVLG